MCMFVYRYTGRQTEYRKYKQHEQWGGYLQGAGCTPLWHAGSVSCVNNRRNKKKRRIILHCYTLYNLVKLNIGQKNKIFIFIFFLLFYFLLLFLFLNCNSLLLLSLLLFLLLLLLPIIIEE